MVSQRWGRYGMGKNRRQVSAGEPSPKIKMPTKVKKTQERHRKEEKNGMEKSWN